LFVVIDVLLFPFHAKIKNLGLLRCTISPLWHVK